MSTTLSRRALLGGTAAGLGLGAMGSASAGQGAGGGGLRRIEAQPLATPVPMLGIAQLQDAPGGGWRRTSRHRRLEAMLAVVDQAFAEGRRHDLLWFHGNVLQPSSCRRTPVELEAEAIDLDGEELAALAVAARNQRCHLAFGARVRDSDWPGRVLALQLLIDDRGVLIGRHWQARPTLDATGRRLDPGVTTLEDVLEEYVERYGAHAVLPVTATRVGTLALHAGRADPELLRILAARGAELLLRDGAEGFSRLDIAAGSLHNAVYTAVAGVAEPDAGWSALPGDRLSEVFGPRGECLAGASTHRPQLLSVRLPLAEYRRRRRVPELAAAWMAAFG
jgi:predicted amidohydrolase